MYEDEPLITRINRLMQGLEEHTMAIQEISVELNRIVQQSKEEENDWK